MSVVSFLSSHAGSGCTVQSTSVARFLATEHKKRVLLVDACSQCTATDCFTTEEEQEKHATLCGLVLGEAVDEGKPVYKCSPENGELYLLCGDLDKIDLQNRITADSESAQSQSPLKVRDVILALIERLVLDYVIIDLGQDARHSVAWSLLLASHAVVVTCTPFENNNASLGLGPPVQTVMEMTSRFLDTLRLNHGSLVRQMYVPPIIASARLWRYTGDSPGSGEAKWLFDRAFCVRRDIPRINRFMTGEFVALVEEARADKVHRARQLIAGESKVAAFKSPDFPGSEMDSLSLILERRDVFEILEKRTGMSGEQLRQIINSFFV